MSIFIERGNQGVDRVPDDFNRSDYVDLGPLLTPADIIFLRNRNLDMDMSRTEAEKRQTEAALTKLSNEMRWEAEDKISQAILAAGSQGGVVVERFNSRKANENRFRLTMKPIGISMELGVDRTHVNFPQNTEYGFEPNDFYSLFFGRIPPSIFAQDPRARDPQFVKNLSMVIVTPEKISDKKIYDFRKPFDKKDFEKRMETPESIIWITTNISTDQGLYSFSIPNPLTEKERLVRLSFPTGNPLSSETLKELLVFHRDIQRVEGEEYDYSSLLTGSINVLRERLGVS